MDILSKLLIIAITWTVLFVPYTINRFLLKGWILSHSPKIVISMPAVAGKPPGTFLSKAGVLFVFAVNIITIILLVSSALSPSIAQSLILFKIDLPYWINLIGSLLFVMGNIWGFFAMVFNPNYTPLYRVPPRQFVLATQGPYGVSRHPRYAAEAFLNIALFLFTGFWLPLLGLIGWIGIYAQACAEESYLMALPPKEYGEYRNKTNSFFPKLRR